jgi:hypothetical protein
MIPHYGTDPSSRGRAADAISNSPARGTPCGKIRMWQIRHVHPDAEQALRRISAAELARKPRLALVIRRAAR